MATNATLEADVTYMEVNSHVGTVKVGASDSATVASVRTETFSQNAPHTVKSSVSEVSNDARIQAGEHLRWAGLVGPGVEERRNCTAGPGAYEWMVKKANGQPIKAEFLLTAGHCFAMGDLVEKSVNPRGTDNFNWIGKTTRTAYPGHEHYEEDAEAFRLEGYGAPRYTYRAGRTPLGIQEAGWIRPGETLCFSGVSTGAVTCGAAVGVRAVKLSTSDELHHGRMLGIRFRGSAIHGDSGSVVWEGRTKEVVGILDGSLEGDLIAAPLLRPHGFPYERRREYLTSSTLLGAGTSVSK